jgi:hypothetical protein
VVRILRWARDVMGVEGTEGRNPFEQFMLLWSVLTILSILSAPTPGSVLADLPSWVVIGCYILLCIGGSVGLVGVWLRNLILSLLVERASMIVVGPTSLFFAGAIFTQLSYNPRALSAAMIVAAFSLASFWRLYRIQSYLQAYRSSIRKAAKSE